MFWDAPFRGNSIDSLNLDGFFSDTRVPFAGQKKGEDTAVFFLCRKMRFLSPQNLDDYFSSSTFTQIDLHFTSFRYLRLEVPCTGKMHKEHSMNGKQNHRRVVDSSSKACWKLLVLCQIELHKISDMHGWTPVLYTIKHNIVVYTFLLRVFLKYFIRNNVIMLDSNKIKHSFLECCPCVVFFQ